MVSNGPYLLKEWRLNDYLLLEANPHYWRRVAVPRIKVLPTNNATALLQSLSLGQDRPAHRQDQHPAPARPRPPGQALLPTAIRSARPLRPLQRQAQALRRRPGPPGLRPRPSTSATSWRRSPARASRSPPRSSRPARPATSPPRGLAYDPAEARRLLAAAGYPGGAGFPDVSLLYAARGTGSSLATEMQALWRRELGITSIHLRGQEWKVYLNSQSLIDFDFCLSAWIGDYNDPQTLPRPLRHRRRQQRHRLGQPALRPAPANLRGHARPGPALRLLHDMEKILVEDDVPIMPVYFYVGMSLYRPEKLGGFEPNFVDDHRWGEFYIRGKNDPLLTIDINDITLDSWLNCSFEISKTGSCSVCGKGRRERRIA